MSEIKFYYDKPAIDLLKRNGYAIVLGGVITNARCREGDETPAITAAINYLCTEWDFCYISQDKLTKLL